MSLIKMDQEIWRVRPWFMHTHGTLEAESWLDDGYNYIYNWDNTKKTSEALGSLLPLSHPLNCLGPNKPSAAESKRSAPMVACSPSELSPESCFVKPQETHSKGSGGWWWLMVVAGDEPQDSRFTENVWAANCRGLCRLHWACIGVCSSYDLSNPTRLNSACSNLLCILNQPAQFISIQVTRVSGCLLLPKWIQHPGTWEIGAKAYSHPFY